MRGTAGRAGGAWAWAAIGTAMLAACAPAVIATPAPVTVVVEAPETTNAPEAPIDEAPPREVVDPDPGTSTGSETPYDCDGIRPAGARFPVRVSAVTADLVEAVHPEAPRWLAHGDALVAALARVEPLDPEAMSTFERVVLRTRR